MPRWTENDYVRHAKDIARQHVASKRTITDLSEKFAEDNCLGPEEIRTLVRLANVAAFQELFQQKADTDAGDRMVEFETGDPEAVIRRLVDGAQTPVESANVNNDKYASYEEIPDMMRDVRRGFTLDEPTTEKQASEPEPPQVRRDKLILSARKLSEELYVEKIAADQKWQGSIKSLERSFRLAPGYGRVDHSEFEKAAYATYGSDCEPELVALREGLRLEVRALDSDKVASLQERYVADATPELEQLKQAMEIRSHYHKCADSLDWLSENMPKLEV